MNAVGFAKALRVRADAQNLRGTSRRPKRSIAFFDNAANLQLLRSFDDAPAVRFRTREAEIGADEKMSVAIPFETPRHFIRQSIRSPINRELTAAEHAMHAEARYPDRAFAIFENVARPIGGQSFIASDDAPSVRVVNGETAIGRHPKIAARIESEIAAVARRRQRARFVGDRRVVSC